MLFICYPALMTRILDFSLPDYNGWLRLVFDHPTREDELGNNYWIWEDGLDFEVSDSSVLIAHMTRLCNGFVVATSDYSLQQIDGGIWTLLSEPVRLGDHLAEESVPLEARLRCITSMFQPYKNFVAPSQVEVMENCFDMWWDLIAGGYWHNVNWKYKSDELMARMGLLEPEDDVSSSDATDEEIGDSTSIPDVTWEEISDEERTILDQMLATLTKILALEEGRCEQYVLHGLGHLHHPQRAAVVQKFIDEHADEWPEDTWGWVEDCRDGTVM